MSFANRPRVRWALAPLLLVLAACSDASPTDEAMNAVSEMESALEAEDVDAAAAVFSPSWIEIGIPMSEATTAARPPENEAVDGLAFIDAWMDLEFVDCAAEQPSEGAPVNVRCMANITGTYPEALDIGPFALPVLFRAVDDGLVLFGTDWAMVEDPSFEYPAGTEAYVRSIENFYVYAAGDDDFASANTRGIGRPLITAESAQAHIQKAGEWVAAGRP